MNPWWMDFFDADYLHLWGDGALAGDANRQSEGLWSILQLSDHSRVLDAPCGYGRIAKPLADMGATVLGVDLSEALLAEAQRGRGSTPTDRLRYLRHDLRMPLAESGFDAAVNLFSSLGYGTEDDDLAILRTLRAAVRPGGLVFIETNHRDKYIAETARGHSSASRLPDGTIVTQETAFDPVAGRAETTWHWYGPKGSGQKTASVRTYTVTELVMIVETVGLVFREAYRGCFPEPFVSGSYSAEKRLGLLAARET